MEPLSPIEALRAARLATLTESIGVLPGAFVHMDLHAIYGSMGINFHFLNAVVHADVNDANVDVKVKEIIKAFEEKKMSFVWWLLEGSKEEVLLSVKLPELGFVQEHPAPGMTFDLSQPLPSLPNIPGLEIKIPKTAAEFRVYFETVTKGFDAPPEFVDVFGQMSPIVTDLKRAFIHYLAFVNGAPVATSMCVVASHGVMGIYNVSVVPELRRKGLGAMMTVECMKEAKKRGMAIAVLESSAVGKPLYEKLKFQTVAEFKLFVKAFE